MQTIDVNHEYSLVHWRDGIKLSPANQNIQAVYTNVSDLERYPFNCYFIDTNSAIQHINPICAEANGFYSQKSAHGKTVLDYAEKNSALFTLNHDQSVMKLQKKLILEQEYSLKTGLSYSYLTIKLPWYSLDNKLLGIFGCSIALHNQPLAESLIKIANIGLLIPSQDLKVTRIANVNLSKRESECLRYYVYGKSSKEIANILHISARTVEFYLENIKNKLGVFSKADLIEKVLSYFNIQF